MASGFLRAYAAMCKACLLLLFLLLVCCSADPATMDVPHRPADTSSDKQNLKMNVAASTSNEQQEQKQKQPQPEEDDPTQAWNEWDETPELKKRQPARRVRGVQPGMDIHAIMSQMDKKEKIYFAHVGDMTPKQGQALVDRYAQMLAAGGVLAQLFYVPDSKQIVVKCQSVRDAFVSKDFFVRQPEILKVILDGMPHTPLPKPKDDDDDDDEEKSEL